MIPNKHISRPLAEPNLRFSNRSHCQKCDSNNMLVDFQIEVLYTERNIQAKRDWLRN